MCFSLSSAWISKLFNRSGGCSGGASSGEHDFDLGKILGRSGVVESADDRAQIAAMLQEEAKDLARGLPHPGEVERFAHRVEAVQKMTSGELKTLFDPAFLQRSYPAFQFGGRFGSAASSCAAFAVEALRKGLCRCIGFNFQGFDTHAANYRAHPAALQELFNLVFALVTTLDNTPHPASPARKLSDSTHIFVMSEFCRTPQINQAAGRDHYPNNSALLISPRLRAPALMGGTDPDQLLPMPISGFAAGARAITPADVLSTLTAAVGVDPKPHFRDGEVLRALLR
ncbi:MAG: DUF1501 domain-containing protein [Polyangiaceae bacterium]|nr:DUF1501 domain-containing protein [Polyangiaceae bacterium]